MKRHTFIISLLCIASAFCGSCGQASQAKAAETPSAVATDFSDGLPLPQVPETLRTPLERANYVVEHYWDAMDFSNRKYALDDVFMEQAFANYAQVLPIADANQLQGWVDALMLKASADKDAYAKLADIAQLYLFEYESPVFNEQLYRYFVQAQLANPDIDAAKRARLEYQLETIDMNAPGTPATDFDVIMHDGKKANLLELISGSPSLVIFYDPDCEDCHNAMAIIAAEPMAQQLIEEGKMKVIAIADADTRERWQEAPLAPRKGWTDACDITGIQDQELYAVDHTPTFYWLDSMGTVVLKNRPLGEMLQQMDLLLSDK